MPQHGCRKKTPPHHTVTRAQARLRPKHTYMRKQRDISYAMRAILVDWLVEVAEEYKLSTHTLFLAVAYIDRFLSEMAVQRGKLQLVGVTCMLLAAKYEEIYPPAIDEFVYITDNTYTRDQASEWTIFGKPPFSNVAVGWGAIPQVSLSSNIIIEFYLIVFFGGVFFLHPCCGIQLIVV